MASAPPEIALDALAYSMGNDGPVLDALARLTVPVVAINPDDEPTDVESLARRGVRTVIVPGVGHFPMLEDPARFDAALARGDRRLRVRSRAPGASIVSA